MGGLLTALVLASGIIGQIMGGRLGDRYPRHKILGWVVAANIPTLLLMSYLKGPFIIVAAVVWGTTNFVYQPIANAIIADNSSIRQRGTLFGIFNGLAFGVGALAAALAGETNRSVALADLDTRFGDVGIMMDVSAEKSIADLGRLADGLNRELVRDHLFQQEVYTVIMR